MKLFAGFKINSEFDSLCNNVAFDSFFALVTYNIKKKLTHANTKNIHGLVVKTTDFGARPVSFVLITHSLKL